MAAGGQAVGSDLAVCPIHRRRLFILAALLTCVFGWLVVRLLDLQVVRHDVVVERTRFLMSSYSPLRGMRGDITTRDGTLLAREVIEYTIAVDPGILSPENLPRAVDLLCRSVGMSEEGRRAIHARIAKLKSLAERGLGEEPRFVELERGVKAGLVDELREAVGRLLPPLERRAVIFQPVHHRQYPRGDFLGVAIGATSPGPAGDDLMGSAGLELVLDGSLSGKDGQRKLRCEGRRIDRWYTTGEVDIEPVHGYNAVLTIDGQIQGIAEEELEKGLEREKASAGVVIVLDCRSGDILAMVNLPGLDPNHYHDYPPSEFQERRKNRAVESQFEPGSTIKPFVAAVALEKGLCTADQRIWDGGRVKFFGRRRVEDVSDHGPISVAEAVIYSSNVGMAHIGLRLGRDGLIETLDRFHFQRRTGLRLPGEAVGKRAKRSEWSETYTSISVSFGYECMVTPIQLCAAFASLINGGRYWAPRLVDRLERDGEVVALPPRELGRPIREETSRQMREILRGVVERGTAKMLKLPGLAFGGKTGTAHLSGRGGYVGREYLSSFIAFAPADDPKVVVLVMIERPRIRHYGSTVCGPVVVEILRRAFRVEEPARADSIAARSNSGAGGNFGASNFGAGKSGSGNFGAGKSGDGRSSGGGKSGSGARGAAGGRGLVASGAR